MDNHIKSLTETLTNMREDLDLMIYLINDYQDPEKKLDVIDRYHADLKIHMQGIRHVKGNIYKWKLTKKTKTNS
jgi:hypothetical protein